MAHRSEISALIGLVERQGLAHMPGRLLYSGAGTLVPGPIYMLGYNPGGDPAAEADSPTDHLRNLMCLPPDWNEYVNGRWFPGGRACLPGEAPMQKRVRFLLQGIGVPVRTVCASNLIFVRSRNAEGLARAGALADRCWPVHEHIIGLVKPWMILCIGGKPVFDAVVRRGRLLSAPAGISAGHGSWSCVATSVQLSGRAIRLVAVPHLSRYDITNYPAVIRWVAAQVALHPD